MYKLLIVDDDEVICRGLGSCIPWKEYGIQNVHLAYDGEMALEYVEKEHPDIILADINMPFMDGMEFSMRVRQEYPDIKIILLTAYKEFQYAKKAVQLQIFEYLTKPFTNEEVLEAVLRAIKQLDKEKYFRTEAKMNLELIKEKNLEEMILYGRNDDEVWKNSFLTKTRTFLQVAILRVRMNGYASDKASKALTNEEVVREWVIKEFRKMLDEEQKMGIFIQSSRIVMVFQYESRDETKNLTDRLNTIMERLEREEPFFLTVGVGQTYQGIENGIRSYEEAAEVVEKESVYDGRSIVYFSHLSDIEKRVNQAVEYIKENYLKPDLSLEEVSRFVNLSSSYLGNSIKKYKNVSYINLLNQIRIENAKRLLLKADIKTYEVAFLVGFNSSQYFSSCFKKATGMTPKDFREKYLKH